MFHYLKIFLTAAFALLLLPNLPVSGSEPTCFATANGGRSVYVGDTAYAVQRAINQTFNVDGVVRIAGYCPGDVLINDRTMIVRGGYSPTDWTISDPDQFPTTLAGTERLSVMRISAPSDSLTIENLIITGGDAYRGGGIQVTDVDSLTLRNVTLHGNHAGDYGGGLYVGGGDVLIEDSFISNNSSALYGGGIYSNESLTVINSTLENNRAAEFGGGIYNSGAGELTIENTTMCDNFVTSNVSGGGAIFNRGELTMRNSTVSGNSAESQTRRLLGTGGGGGLWNNGGTATLIHTTFANNRADNNGGYEFGGAIFNNNAGVLHLTRNLFADNVGGGCINQATLGTNSDNADEDGNCDVNIVGQLDLPPLADNGGTTFTHALDPNHRALDVAGDNCLATDQRGVQRQQTTVCDIGAFELSEVTPTAVSLVNVSADSSMQLLLFVGLMLLGLTVRFANRP